MTIYIKKQLQTALFFVLTKWCSFIKISFIIGSQMAWFSLNSVLVPLSGAFFGLVGSSVLLVMRFIAHIIIFKTISLSFFAFVIPGYCASLYWATRNALVGFVLPAVCIVLFVVHPVGNQAFVYAFYWCIPLMIYISSRKSLFLQALGSTFVAHAVGSVIWLYTTTSTAAMWLELIPLVAVERLLCAVGMVVGYKIFMGSTYVKTSCMYYGWKSTMGHAAGIITGTRAS